MTSFYSRGYWSRTARLDCSDKRGFNRRLFTRGYARKVEKGVITRTRVDYGTLDSKRGGFASWVILGVGFAASTCGESDKILHFLPLFGGVHAYHGSGPDSLSALSQVTCRPPLAPFDWHLCCSNTERVDRK